MRVALLALLLAACNVAPDAPAPDAGTCDLTVALFVHEFVAGVEVGCDAELTGNATPSHGTSAPMEHLACYDPPNDAGPGILGQTVFRFTAADAYPVNVAFDGFPGFYTLVFNLDDCVVFRSVSVFR